MTRLVWHGVKTIMIAVIVLAMLSFTGAVAGAEQLESKDLTIAPLWYQPHVLASIDEAAETINNFKSLFSDWMGHEIKQLNADLSGVRFVAVLNSSEIALSIPAKDITDLKLLHFPFLERDNKWGIDIRFSNGSKITLRARALDVAQKVIDVLATLAVANGCKLPSPIGLIIQTENTAAEFTRLNWTTGKGVLVNAVFSGSPADQAGLMRDDIITEVNGQAITDQAALANTVNKSLEDRAESKLELKVFRNGQLVTKTLIIKNLYFGISVNSSTLKPGATANVAPQSLGIAARNLTAEETQKAGLGEQIGIFITSIDPGSLAEQMGMKPGDYLLEFNGKKVANVGSLKQLLASGGVIQDLKIWRGGQVMVLSGVNKL
ncbi:MAG: PDZ domain-containing protein [Bacteroidota bacterium]